MSDIRTPLPRPEDYKTTADGTGGLVRAVLDGGPHEGIELFMDELDLPAEIWTSGEGHRFEWWPSAVAETMSATALGSDPEAPPVRYRLEIPDETREPRFVAEPAAEVSGD